MHTWSPSTWKYARSWWNTVRSRVSGSFTRTLSSYSQTCSLPKQLGNERGHRRVAGEGEELGVRDPVVGTGAELPAW